MCVCVSPFSFVLCMTILHGNSGMSCDGWIVITVVCARQLNKGGSCQLNLPPSETDDDDRSRRSYVRAYSGLNSNCIKFALFFYCWRLNVFCREWCWRILLLATNRIRIDRLMFGYPNNSLQLACTCLKTLFSFLFVFWWGEGRKKWAWHLTWLESFDLVSHFSHRGCVQASNLHTQCSTIVFVNICPDQLCK